MTNSKRQFMNQRGNEPSEQHFVTMTDNSRADMLLILHGKEYRAAINISPHELQHCKPIATCDDTLIAIASGEAKSGSRQEYILKRRRAEEVQRLFLSLADHVIGQIEKDDTVNGYKKGAGQ